MNESRNWILPIVVSAVLCSVAVALATTAVGNLEFHYAKWTHFPRSLPAIAEAFKAVYPVGWLLPLTTGIVGVFVSTKKLTNAVAVAWWSSFLVVAHVVWFLFALLSIYLTNQSFIA
jgi:hypothetical protein